MYVSRHKNKFIKSAQTPQGRRHPVIDFQNEIVEMYIRREGEEEAIEKGRGRRFIRWAFDKRLRANQTVAVMAKLRQNIHNAFYMRYNYAYCKIVTPQMVLTCVVLISVYILCIASYYALECVACIVV